MQPLASSDRASEMVLSDHKFPTLPVRKAELSDLASARRLYLIASKFRRCSHELLAFDLLLVSSYGEFN